MERTESQKFWRIFEIGIIGAILLGVLVLFYVFRDMLAPFIIAFILVFFLNPIVDYMEGEGISRTWAVVGLIFSVLGLLILIGVLSWPLVDKEISAFKENAPTYIKKVQSGLNSTAQLAEKKMTFLPKGTLTKMINDKSADLLVGAASNVDVILGVVMSIVSNAILIPFIVFFLLKDGRQMKKSLIAFVPNKYFETFLCLLYEVNQQISNYIRGQLIDAAIVGILSIALLYMLDIRYAVFIGAIGGIGNIIPYVGPVAGMVVGSVVVLIDTGSGFGIMKIIVVFGCVQLIDEAIISPLAVGKSVDVHPLAVVIAILVGGMFLGAWGMLLAVPLYCSIKVSFQILYRGFVEYGNW